jgi:hypothetical protein
MVEVWKSREKANYKNIQTCGSVWICPVCAAKISERRRVELVQGIETWKKAEAVVPMITLTVPHAQDQPLKKVLEGFGKARELMSHRKPWKRLRRIAPAGTVRALEVTYGTVGMCTRMKFYSSNQDWLLRMNFVCKREKANS